MAITPHPSLSVMRGSLAPGESPPNWAQEVALGLRGDGDSRAERARHSGPRCLALSPGRLALTGRATGKVRRPRPPPRRRKERSPGQGDGPGCLEPNLPSGFEASMRWRERRRHIRAPPHLSASPWLGTKAKVFGLSRLDNGPRILPQRQWCGYVGDSPFFCQPWVRYLNIYVALLVCQAPKHIQVITSKQPGPREVEPPGGGHKAPARQGKLIACCCCMPSGGGSGRRVSSLEA
jgi:hypothetical protein